MAILDEKELTKDLPLLLKGPAKSLIQWLNGLDLNHDGKKDLEQIVPILAKLLPVAAALAPLIDKDELVEWVVAHKWITDRDAAKSALAAALKIINELPKH